MKIICILIAVLFIACPPTIQDSRTFLQRNYKGGELMGHWKTTENQHLYFFQTGRYQILTSDSTVHHHRFRVLSENPTAHLIEIEFLYNDGNSENALCLINGDNLRIQYDKTDVIINATFVDLTAFRE